MSEPNFEKLSAIIDGESALDDKAIRAIAADEALSARWQRYHLIRDGLSNHLPERGVEDISSRVAAALADEPTVLSPWRRRFGRGIMKQAAGLAVAASVATVAVVSVQTTQVATTEQPATVARIEQPQVDTAAIAQAGLRNQLSNQAIRSKLSGYLVNHNEYSVTSRMQGMMPYMRIVGDADIQRNRNEK